MKKIKLLFLSFIISMGLFTSCTNNEIDSISDIQESESVQTVIDEMRTMYNSDGSDVESDHPTGDLIFDFCFDFVYPIELIYNNGTNVTVNSLEELITILISVNNDLFVVGIVFPFDVEVYNSDTNQIEIITINNEAEFIALLESCSFNEPCDCDSEYAPVCVEVETPNGNTIIITYPNECLALCDGFTPNNFVDCENDCNCPSEYEPVCVDVNGEIIEFQNYCFAECEGYDQSDMVDCSNDEGECEIEELNVTVGECNADGTYSITINFNYSETDQEYFDLYIRDDVFIGNYELANLPVTIENFELSGYDDDYIKVCINDIEGCCKEKEWNAPDCNGQGGDCNISELEVEIGECNPNGSYPLTINFDYENTNGQEYFDLFVRNGELIGYYLLSELPLTIPNFELSGYDDDYIKVCINDIEGCCQEIEWEAPDCNGSGEECYTYVFPVSLFLNGVTVTANSNEEIDEYLDLGYYLSYPIDIIINNEVITVQQGIIEGAYGERCD
ncbi:MAG: hypothetical protein QM499_06335 [Flavobacteriaceae bacterium]